MALGALTAAAACARTDAAPAPAASSATRTNGAGAAGGTGGAGSRAQARDVVPSYAASVENRGADCGVPALPEPSQLPKLDTLPDPFLGLGGARISKKSEWRCRREEIARQAQKYIYGDKPPRPEKVAGSVTNDAVSVDVEHAGKSIHFSAEVVLPPGRQGPFPAIINLGQRNAFGGSRLGESFLLEQGVAIIYYNHNELGKEGKPEASRGLPNPGLFYDLYGSGHSAGLLMAWAWGASRLLDVVQASGGGVIDPGRIGVTGCSRNGKGAFTVGAFDERIALTIAHETSTGGVPAYRIVDASEGAERTSWNFRGLNWLANAFEPFVENASSLPIDSHEIVALVAPRGLLVLDNPHIAQFAAPASHAAVLAGAEVYAALGAKDNVGYVSNVADGKHCATGKPEYTEPLAQSIGTFLRRDRAPRSIISASPAGIDSRQWRAWQAPVLGD
jgi:glucuronyl esterase-like protein